MPSTTHDVELHTPVAEYAREAGYETTPRCATRTVPVQERLRSQAIGVEIGLTEDEARREAARCLDCGVNTIFDGDTCVACGGCVDVCPMDCLYLVRADGLGLNDVRSRAESPTSSLATAAAGAELLAIIKDETICIRCGLCAARCPVGAISMQRFQFTSAPVIRQLTTPGSGP